MTFYTEAFKAVLSQNTKFFLAHWFSLLRLSLIVIVPVFVVDFYLWGNEALIDMLVESLSVKGLIALGYFINVVLFFIFMFFNLVYIKFIDAKINMGKLTVGGSLKFAYENSGDFLLTCLKKVFIILAWSLLLIVPGLYKSVTLAFVSFIKVCEPLKDPLRESEAMIKPRAGEFLKMGGRFVILLLSFSLPVLFLVDTLNTFAIEHLFPRTSIVIGYGEYIAIFLLFLFSVSFFYFLYRSWRKG